MYFCCTDCRNHRFTGKSNVLSGIDFGLSFIKASIDDKMEMMANSSLIPLNQRMHRRNYKFEVEVLTEVAGREYRVQYGYEFSWQCDEDDEPEIVHEYLKCKLDEKGQKYTQLINRTKRLYCIRVPRLADAHQRLRLRLRSLL